MAFLCDSNVWLAIALSDHIHTAVARRWLETIDGVASVLFCRQTQQTLLRLLTTTSVMSPYSSPPLTNGQAWAVYDALLTDARIVLQHREPPTVDRRWREYTNRDSASPKLWMDAYLAAFACEGGYQLVTTDRAFSQFTDLELILISHS